MSETKSEIKILKCGCGFTKRDHGLYSWTVSCSEHSGNPEPQWKYKHLQGWQIPDKEFVEVEQVWHGVYGRNSNTIFAIFEDELDTIHYSLNDIRDTEVKPVHDFHVPENSYMRIGELKRLEKHAEADDRLITDITNSNIRLEKENKQLERSIKQYGEMRLAQEWKYERLKAEVERLEPYRKYYHSSSVVNFDDLPTSTPPLEITGWEKVDEEGLQLLYRAIIDNLGSDLETRINFSDNVLCKIFRKHKSTDCGNCPASVLRVSSQVICYRFISTPRDNRRAFLTKLLAEVEKRELRLIDKATEDHIPTLSVEYVLNSDISREWKDRFLCLANGRFRVPIKEITKALMGSDILFYKRWVVGRDWLISRDLICDDRKIMGGKYDTTGKSL